MGRGHAAAHVYIADESYIALNVSDAGWATSTAHAQVVAGAIDFAFTGLCGFADPGDALLSARARGIISAGVAAHAALADSSRIAVLSKNTRVGFTAATVFTTGAVAGARSVIVAIIGTYSSQTMSAVETVNVLSTLYRLSARSGFCIALLCTGTAGEDAAVHAVALSAYAAIEAVGIDHAHVDVRAPSIALASSGSGTVRIHEAGIDTHGAVTYATAQTLLIILALFSFNASPRDWVTFEISRAAHPATCIHAHLSRAHSAIIAITLHKAGVSLWA